MEELQLDPPDQPQAARTVWSAPLPGWCRYMGDADRLPNGNTVASLGMLDRLVEVDPEGAVVWSMQFSRAPYARATARARGPKRRATARDPTKEVFLMYHVEKFRLSPYFTVTSARAADAGHMLRVRAFDSIRRRYTAPGTLQVFGPSPGPGQCGRLLHERGLRFAPNWGAPAEVEVAVAVQGPAAVTVKVTNQEGLEECREVVLQ